MFTFETYTEHPPTHLRVLKQRSFAYLGLFHKDLAAQAADALRDAVDGDLRQALQPFLDYVAEKHMSQEINSVNFEVRIQRVSSEYDIRRWHSDGSYWDAEFDTDPMPLKVSTTLCGRPTVFLQPSELTNKVMDAQRTAANAFWHQYPDVEWNSQEFEAFDRKARLEAHRAFQGLPIFSAQRRQAALFDYGNGNDSALHSEPSFDEPRVYVAVLPGTEAQIRNLCKRWKKEFQHGMVHESLTAVGSQRDVQRYDDDAAVYMTRELENAASLTAQLSCLSLVPHIEYTTYESEHQIQDIINLCQDELSEPYSVFTGNPCPQSLSTLSERGFDLQARDHGKPIGVIVCKQDIHDKSGKNRGYIAMLSVLPTYRKQGIATILVEKVIAVMIANNAEEVVLETEVDNKAALSLYERLGFIREKRLHAFYLHRQSAFRLVKPIQQTADQTPEQPASSLGGP